MKNTKQVTLAAMIIALVAILQLFNTITASFFTGFMPFIYPIPYVVYASQNKLGASMAMYSASLIVLFMVAPLPQFLLIAMYGLIGVFFGWGYRNRHANVQLIIHTSLFIVVINLLTVFLFGSFFGIDLQRELISLIEVMPMLTMDMATIVYYGIILLGSYLEAFVITMLCLILFAYLKMPTIRRVRWYQYPVKRYERLVIILFIAGLSVLYWLWPNSAILLAIIVLVLYLGYILLAAGFNTVVNHRKKA